MKHGIRVRTSGYFGALEDQSHDSQNLQPFIPLIHVAHGRAVGVRAGAACGGCVRGLRAVAGWMIRHASFPLS